MSLQSKLFDCYNKGYKVNIFTVDGSHVVGTIVEISDDDQTVTLHTTGKWQCCIALQHICSVTYEV